MSECQKRALKGWAKVLAIMTLVVTIVAGVALEQEWAMLLLLLITFGYFAILIGCVVCEVILWWRCLGVLNTPDEKDVYSWFKLNITDDSIDDAIYDLEQDYVSYVEALGKDGTIKVLEKLKRVKRPKFFNFWY